MIEDMNTVNDNKTISIELEQSVVRGLEEQAKGKGVTFNALLREHINKALGDTSFIITK